eukprot:TRINITY_DN8538_c0_g1_i4.p1 TRINITY_DN8538_c0_g1~~TRINITY_DN8538_c0_g1_i4.p1  ORF type:complete len:386 (-),score=108.80 TRINITY_DN8538_c0_g1_i4:515-1672(-)
MGCGASAPKTLENKAARVGGVSQANGGALADQPRAAVTGNDAKPNNYADVKVADEPGGGSRGSLKKVAVSAPRLSLFEFEEVTENFSHDRLIGEGSYGRVYYGEMHDGRRLAVKKLDSTSQPDEEFIAEVGMQSRLKHENVTQLEAYCVEGPNRVLAYEFAPSGSLHDLIHGKKGKDVAVKFVLPWTPRVKIVLGAALGMKYLHEEVEPPIVHKDIKSSNILVFDDYMGKIADYNVANEAPDQASRLHSTRVLGSFGYRAPEYAMTGQLTDKSDVYSFGVVLLELLTGRKPVDPNMPRGQQSLVTWAIPRLAEEKVEQCVDPRLKGVFPLKTVAKFAAIAQLCVQYEADFRPAMSVVAQALGPLLAESEAYDNGEQQPVEEDDEE